MTAPMKPSLLAFSFFFYFYLSSADDASVMLRLNRSFTSPPPGWMTSDPCHWRGVSCDSSDRVTVIDLKSRSLEGNLSSHILNQLTELRSLSLQDNQISGSLPSLSNLNNLEEVYFDGNRFTSLPSRFLSNLPNLQTLTLDNNPLRRWTLPGDDLSQLNSLQVFRASNSNVYGRIPDIFGSLTSLQELRLSYNDLTGPLPDSLSGSAIQNLWINDQKSKFSGALELFAEMPSLAQAWLHNNAFTGSIPDLSDCTELFDLQLRGNKLTGLVPPSLTTLPKLTNISLQNNLLQGPMPKFRYGVHATVLPSNSFCNLKPGDCDPQVTVLLKIAESFGYPMKLAESWKGNDACNDWPHVTCDSTGKIVIGLNMAMQGFSGTITPLFSNLTALTTLNLRGNKIYGKIPSSLLRLEHLQHLDVSSNNLTGNVPDFPDDVKVDIGNNPYIGTNVDTTPGAQSKGHGNSSLRFYLLIVGIGIIFFILVGALLFFIYSALKRKEGMKLILGQGFRRRRGERQRHNSSHGSPMASSAGAFDAGSATYPMEVLQEVTDNFSDENILGKGGFGIVYKGELHDGNQIAVKRMESDSLGIKGLSEFQAEIAVLSKVRHRHLVALLGYCIDGNERFLVYEYVPEGTLGQHLFEWEELGRSPLTWKQRLVIALDVARGVEYLHSLAQESFIHRDLKPSNILLGSDMRAKVSDFGLLRNAPDEYHSVETRLAGTFGYLAPEYTAIGRVTTKVDIYAYGVVLMETITGRKALDETLPDEVTQLVTWFRRALIDKETIRKAFDPCMELDEEMYESACKVAELAGHCTAREPSQRPDMGHVVSVLTPLVEEWKPVEREEEQGSVSISVEISLPEALRKWQAGETSAVSTDGNRSQSLVTSSAPSTPPRTNTAFDDIEGR